MKRLGRSLFVAFVALLVAPLCSVLVGGPAMLLAGSSGGTTSGGGSSSGAATSVQGSATLPATCTEKDLYQDTDSGGTEFYVCTAANTWTKAGSGDGTIGGTLGATDNGVCRADGTGGVTAQGSPLTLSDVSGVTTTLATITPAATTGASVAGQSLAITASPAVASTDTAGAAAGGSITITAGAAARNASGNAAGGGINLVTGAGIGTGAYGSVIVPANPNQNLALAFAGDTDTGVWWDGANSYSLVSDGHLRLTISNPMVASVDLYMNGKLLYGFLSDVEANTAGVGTPNAINSASSSITYTNEGTTAKNYHTLPTAASELTFSFCTQDADGIRVVANTSDTIRVIDKVTAAAGYIESTTIGSCVTLIAINATEWFATDIHGTWTDGTFTYDDTSLTTP